MLKLVTKRCKGCGICVNFCPKKVLEVTEVGKCAIIKDKEKDCIQCGQCEMRCPDYAGNCRTVSSPPAPGRRQIYADGR